jgi:GntR family transcriptional regulator/MocR family aminotransferase
MHEQICRSLRDAIRARRLQAGAPVPSTRTLAIDLGVSRGVVVQAYEQLIAEGYLVSAQGAATRVSESVRGPVTAPPEPDPAQPELDFRPGEPDLRAFPYAAWTRCFRDAFDATGSRQLGYGDPRGATQLRAALSEYLGRTRGVVSTPNQIVVCTGCAQGLGIAVRLLRQEGIDQVALETPGHPEIRQIVTESGLGTVSVPVDHDGLVVDALEALPVRAVIVSPAHQNPMGGVLPPARRQQLLAWATRVSGFVIEDDYDAEYRYDRAAIGALQGLTPDRVLYVGSASKILAPALRLGWLLPGSAFLDRGIQLKRRLDNGSGVIEQLIYARFVASGELDRHVRRMRGLYRSRRDALLAALEQRFPGWRAHGAAAGLHLVAETPPELDLDELVLRSAARSVRLYPLDGYTSHGRRPRGLVFGYARLTEEEIAEAVRRMERALAAMSA